MKFRNDILNLLLVFWHTCSQQNVPFVILIAMKLFYEQNSLKPGIYQIVNTQTKRIYVGQAKRFKQRWLQHRHQLLKGSHGNSFLQSDFNKCREELGHDDFLEFRILEVMEGSTKEQRNKREKETYFDLSSCSTLYNHQKSFDCALGYKFKNKEAQSAKQQEAHAKFQKPVVQFDLHGHLVAKFSGIRAASRATSIHQVQIGNCAKGKQKTAKGFVFLYEGCSVDELKQRLKKRCFTEEHKRNISKGSKRLSGENHPQFGTRPSSATLEKQRMKRQKAVVQFDLKTKQEICKWDSITKASKFMRVDGSAIGKVCHGKKEHAGGFGWKFC
jgi:hypothetical protein